MAPPDTPPRRRRGRPVSVGLAEKRLAQITRAAYEVFVERSYEEATVGDIASRAGVGHGTLYRYVRGKRELLDLVVDWCADQLLGAIDPDTVLDAARSNDPLALQETVDELGTRLFQLADAEPGLLRILTVQSSAVDRELRYRITGIYNTVDALAVRVVTTAAENGWMIDGDEAVLVTARTLPALALPGAMLALTGEGRDSKRAEYVAAASELAQYGLLGTGRHHRRAARRRIAERRGG
ncbi:TetR/AcrR family transcriptional regulator [Gordonia sp. X0973]|uniref:TetR/AcrR family transcriptional regulator n=1 Tax=Gordonia sp. X0973 TaxID=2742602 RepID=UPI000F538078|nr:TetR/AcrR family transcriptional regulator [Gordonia sp. X0973]QKT06121.1 TetR/AcrR family transcriptional regulator [Gordonia sp. X0973]